MNVPVTFTNNNNPTITADVDVDVAATNTNNDNDQIDQDTTNTNNNSNGKRRKRLLKPHLNETHHNDTKLMACISPEASQVPRLTCFWVGELDYSEASWGLSIFVQRLK